MPDLDFIEVLVTPGRWDTVGDPTNPYHRILHEMLKAQGGVSDTVPLGTYKFYAEPQGDKLILHLDPA